MLQLGSRGGGGGKREDASSSKSPLPGFLVLVGCGAQSLPRKESVDRSMALGSMKLNPNPGASSFEQDLLGAKSFLLQSVAKAKIQALSLTLPPFS